MTKLMSQLCRQAAAIGLLFALFGVFVVQVVLPFANNYSAMQEKIEDQRVLLGRLQQFATNKGKAEQLADRNNTLIRSGIFLSGRTDALRAANLQALLTQVAQNNGIRLRSTRTLATTKRDGLRFISVQAVMSADMKQIQSLLLTLESMEPYLFIQNLQIGQPASHRPDDDNLEFRVGVMGAVAEEQG